MKTITLHTKTNNNRVNHAFRIGAHCAGNDSPLPSNATKSWNTWPAPCGRASGRPSAVLRLTTQAPAERGFVIVCLSILLLFLLAGCGAPEKPTITLYLAMQRGDIEQIERHIAWGTDMNQLDRDGYAPLHIAVRKGRIAITQLLIKQGVDIHVRDRNGRTAMHHAVLGAHPRIADLLLKAGAELDADTLLLDAVQQGVSKREVIRYLADHGASLETKDDRGDTPLLTAIRQGNHKLAKHLVNFGANVTATDAEGKTALEIAKSLGLRDIALLLQRNGAT